MLNTFVAGNPGSVRASADAIRQTGAGVDETAEGWHRARSRSESAWEGQAAEGFRDSAGRNGKDADALAELFTRMAGAMTVFADDLTTVRARMEQAKQAAHEGNLTVLPNAIQPPAAPPTGPPAPLQERASATDSAAHSQATADFQAAQALHSRQQAAFAEAQAIVAEARQIEQAAHAKLTDALNAASNGLGALTQSGAWGTAAATPTSPAAAALAGAAAALENHSANATRGMFEKAAAGGPAAVSAAWSSMSTAQRGELSSTYPQMVGSTNGVPAVARDHANRSILGAQRQALVQKIREAEQTSAATRLSPQLSGQKRAEADGLRETLHGLDNLDAELQHGDKYLLGIDSTAADRGHVIVANGNPDTADHVLTYVPGTTSDLGNAVGDIQRNEALMHRAHELDPGQRTSAIMWGGYDSPPNLADASSNSYAEHGEHPLSQFQEGLRTTHEGPPSHNTVLGHSYGTTVVGEAGRDYGLHANDVAFIGSPGVGVDHANQLGVSPDHVYSGTAGQDPIDTYTPSGNLIDDGNHAFFGGPDMHWFGRNPSDPTFGAHTIPTSPDGVHTDYWNHRQSLDGMAKIAVGQTGSSAPHP